MASGSSDAGKVSSSPASILLAKEAHIAFSRNHTTASAKRSGNDSTVEVTFWTADPPDVSYYTLYCKPLMANPDADDLEVQSHVDPVPVYKAGDVRTRPRVMGAEGRFVLLGTFFCDYCRYEYFMYKGDPKSPSLESLPLPDGDDYDLRDTEFAIVPRGDDGHYLLIGLCPLLKTNSYRLHIYSSEDATWKTKELPNPCPCPWILIIPDRVFVIRDGLLLWVDLLRGIVTCDMLQEPHKAEYIPLPEPLLGNRERVLTLELGVGRFRDLTCVNGLIKFIEMEHREIETKITVEKLIDPKTKDVLYDSDLFTLINDRPLEPEVRTEVLVNGWSAMTWTRNIGSNCWGKGHVVDVDDILVDDSVLSVLWSSEKSESAGNLTFKNLSSAWPTLSTDGNDILYLRSCSEPFSASGVGAMVAVDLAEKKVLKVEARTSHPFEKYFYSSPLNMLRPCALANHLKMTPGTETSASQIALMDSSANVPNNTAIHVSEIDSYESENKCPRQPVFVGTKTSASQITLMDSSSNEPNSTAIHVSETDSYDSENKPPRQPVFVGTETSASHIALVDSAVNEPNSTAIHVSETDSYESKNKRPRLLADKVNHARNGAQEYCTECSYLTGPS